MKKSLLPLALFAAGLVMSGNLRAQVNDPGQVAKDGATNHVNDNISNGVDNGLNKTENAIKGLFKKKNKTAPAANTNANAAGTNSNGTAAQATPAGPVSLKTYANYDFVPGEKIIFEDNFADDQDGEFPAHWKLGKGQAIINKVNGGEQAFFLTEGNYVRVAPRMKTEKDYLPSDFTVEFDFFFTDGSYPPVLLFTTKDDQNRNVNFGKEVSTGYFPNDLSADYPGDQTNYAGKWHHAAMIKKGNQIKCYEDQYRVLVMPDCGSCEVSFVEVGGIGSTENPIVFKNFRIAEGGSMNMIGQKFTDAKIITHGINFDIDKATIKPESMGTLNMIVKILQGNPDLKFEIDGHTDNTGNAPHNLALSQQRADAAKAQLVAMGIDASRLTTKGFGDSRPIADNSTVEGKANNRRIEFVKM
ncbi:MAG: OmpA family protein [Bacteroidota bacterium]|nr:OmpA family protein [Bacteroidota bacterium]MDP4245488.1 OmpA family protein [Bacteroidota bacterium]MDP4253691.1 OmpA family protein [Bacteroidota bacterium]MDP4259975.1 OmpA family protein [Bacteroidota bacterium]